jgi:hypothetical protein
VTPVINHLLARPAGIDPATKCSEAVRDLNAVLPAFLYLNGGNGQSYLVTARRYLCLHIRADGSVEPAEPVDVGSVARPFLVRAVDVAVYAGVLLETVLAQSERVGRLMTRHAVGQAADALRR